MLSFFKFVNKIIISILFNFLSWINCRIENFRRKKKFSKIPSKVPEDEEEEEQKLFGLRIFF